MDNEQASPTPTPAATANVEVKGKSQVLARAAAMFGVALAAGIAAAVVMSPIGTPIRAGISMAGLISQMQAAEHVKQEIKVSTDPTFMDGAKFAPRVGLRSAQLLAPQEQQATGPGPADGLYGREVLESFNEFDRQRAEVLSRPVPSDTRAAAEMARALPLPKTLDLQPPSAEQVRILKYGQFAPVASRVFNNLTNQKETHWALHPWDVVRLAEQASKEVYLERHIRVDPKLIGAAYYAESAGVVQQGWDRKGVELLEKGKSVEHIAKSGSKASYGLFQLDERMGADAKDIDPVASAKRAAMLLAEGQDNARAHPEFGMLAVSATYNASSNLRTKIFSGTPLNDKEQSSFELVQRHAANMSYGAALYEKASATYHQHLLQAERMGIPVAVASDAVHRADPLRSERQEAVNALTGRGRNPTPAYAPDNIVSPDAPATTWKPPVALSAVNRLTGERTSVHAAAAVHPTIQQLERAVHRERERPFVAESKRSDASASRLVSDYRPQHAAIRMPTAYVVQAQYRPEPGVVVNSPVEPSEKEKSVPSLMGMLKSGVELTQRAAYATVDAVTTVGSGAGNIATGAAAGLARAVIPNQTAAGIVAKGMYDSQRPVAQQQRPIPQVRAADGNTTVTSPSGATILVEKGVVMRTVPTANNALTGRSAQRPPQLGAAPVAANIATIVPARSADPESVSGQASALADSFGQHVTSWRKDASGMMDRAAARQRETKVEADRNMLP